MCANCRANLLSNVSIAVRHSVYYWHSSGLILFLCELEGVKQSFKRPMPRTATAHILTCRSSYVLGPSSIYSGRGCWSVGIRASGKRPVERDDVPIFLIEYLPDSRSRSRTMVQNREL